MEYKIGTINLNEMYCCAREVALPLSLQFETKCRPNPIIVYTHALTEDTSAKFWWYRLRAKACQPQPQLAASHQRYRPRIAFLNSAECCCLPPPPPRPWPPRPPVLYSMYTCRGRQTRPKSEMLTFCNHVSMWYT